jgi:hypothetical protein
MSKPPSSRWSELFDIACSLLQQAGERGLGQIEWTFGGGTALMLQIDHRESYDVDIFISDPQYLSLLNPEVQGFNLALTPSDYSLEGGHALKISFGDAGEINFICCAALTDPAARPAEVNDQQVMLETPAEILAKKVVYRGSRLQARDMFDIAAAVQSLWHHEIVAALRPFAAECEAALNVAQNSDPMFTSATLSQLIVHEGFGSLCETAREQTCDLLKAAINSSQ